MSLQDFLAGLGIHAPGNPASMGPNGPTSSYSSPVGPGSLAGALMNMTGGGRALQQLINSNYGLGLGQRGWSDLTGPGGIAAGRGFGLQLVSGGKSKGSSTTTHVAEVSVAKALMNFAKGFAEGVGGEETLVGAAAAGFGLFLSLAGPATLLTGDSPIKKSPPKKGSSGTKYPVGPGGPVSPSPYSPTGDGQYPTVGGPSSGQLSPFEAIAVMHRLANAIKHDGWWRGEWVHLGEGPSSGGGHGPMAPASAVLGGRKHPYDWVASLG